MNNFKKMVRARMAKTGESYQVAQRHVRTKAKKDRPKKETTGDLWPERWTAEDLERATPEMHDAWQRKYLDGEE
jgi:hypothetical protein